MDGWHTNVQPHNYVQGLTGGLRKDLASPEAKVGSKHLLNGIQEQRMLRELQERV
jgi:hypothetical protein